MIGIDLIEVERVDDSPKFLNKILNEKEIEYVCKSIALKKQRIAAFFAVKEAVIKALELGGTNVLYKDIEVGHLPSGKPEIILHGKALEKFNQSFQGKKIEVSLSHTKNYSTAVAIII